MFKWIHHLLEPHCEDCRADAVESKECRSCTSLLHQLEVSNFENRRLVDIIAQMNSRPAVQAMNPLGGQQPVTPPPNWKVVKQQLEADDRKAAQLMREKAAEAASLRAASGGLKANIADMNPNQSNDIDALEKELGVS